MHFSKTWHSPLLCADYGIFLLMKFHHKQCDQKKIAKSLQKLPKIDFTRKIKDFDTFTKIA